LAATESDHPVRAVEEAVVVADREHSLACGDVLRQVLSPLR